MIGAQYVVWKESQFMKIYAGEKLIFRADIEFSRQVDRSWWLHDGIQVRNHLRKSLAT